MGERLFEIVDYIIHALQARRYAQQCGCNADGTLVGFAQLFVGGRGRMSNDRYRIAYHGHMRNQFQRFDECDGTLQCSLQLYRHHARSAVAKIFLRRRIIRIVLESDITHAPDLRMIAEKFGKTSRRLGFMAHPKRQRFQTYHHQIGIERRRAASQIAQSVHTALDLSLIHI